MLLTSYTIAMVTYFGKKMLSLNQNLFTSKQHMFDVIIVALNIISDGVLVLH